MNLIREGLKNFAAGQPLTLKEVFGLDTMPAYRGMERRVLHELVSLDVIDKIDADGIGQPVRFVLKNAQKLVSIVENDEELSGVIWPSSRPPEDPPSMEEPPPAPTIGDMEDMPSSVEEKMDRMIVLFMNAMTSLIYMRDKVDAMEKKVNKIYSDLTGEKE